MKYRKMLGLAVVAAVALIAVVGAGTALATTLYIGAVPQNKSVTINWTLTAGSTWVLKDEGGTTTRHIQRLDAYGFTENRASPDVTKVTGSTVVGGNGTLTFGSCSHITHVLKSGSIHIDGSGNVTSFGAEVIVPSTPFGASGICKTGTGTKIGSFKGINDTTKHVTITIDATNTINCGLLGKATWTGSYTVTSPQA
jgi:hypothetical protein